MYFINITIWSRRATMVAKITTTWK